MSVCKVGAALFLLSPSFTNLDQPMYFLTCRHNIWQGEKTLKDHTLILSYISRIDHPKK